MQDKIDEIIASWPKKQISKYHTCNVPVVHTQVNRLRHLFRRNIDDIDSILKECEAIATFNGVIDENVLISTLENRILKECCKRHAATTSS